MAIVITAPTIPSTSTSFATKVLQKLGRIGVDEAIDSGDQTIVDDAYASVYQEMRDRHLVDWGSDDSVPTWAVYHMVDLVANRIASVYGLPRSVDEEEYAIKKLAKSIASDFAYQPTEADFY